MNTEQRKRSAPQFRKSFGVSKPVLKARLYVCGLGYHESWLNGEKYDARLYDANWAANQFTSENPQWGDGSDFWGEPETGYYLSYEKWMIRRHAQLLSDAGVDVIIFDVTNDRTYPYVYLSVCEVFSAMRKQGEKTPQISFLGSEISVHKLWNKWSAGAQVMGKDINKSLLKWAFYPGAHLGKAGKKLKEGDHYFIDQYNQEFSRDIEPMTGGHTDNYYYQLMANIRQYKGMEKPMQAGPSVQINIRGSFKQWDKVEAVYSDHIGDTGHRNSPGQAGPYVNTSGRNDLVTMKVAYDATSVYFYAETAQPLTPSTDSK